MVDPKVAIATQLRNIEESTGRTIAQWADVIAATSVDKHSLIVTYLKSEHGLTHGNANMLAHQIRQLAAGGAPSDAELLDSQYSGAKAALRPLYDEVLLLAQGLGNDVTVAVKKTGVSLRRRKQFALVEAKSAKRVQLGLNLRDVAPTARFRGMTGMCTHAADLTHPGDVDDEIAGWLRAAYDQAGPGQA